MSGTKLYVAGETGSPDIAVKGNASTGAVLFQVVDTAPLTLTDTTIVLTGLNSTAALACDGKTKFQMILKLGTAATPPTVQLQGSQDGANWYSMGSALAGVASAIQTKEVTDNLPKYIRATVTVIGVTIGAGYSIILRAL